MHQTTPVRTGNVQAKRLRGAISVEWLEVRFA